MESRVRSIFLSVALMLALWPTAVLAVDEVDDDESSLVQPQIERSDFDESLIDSEDFEISVFWGMLAIEDFGTNSVKGFKLSYHVNEDIFVQGVLGNSKAGRTSFEVLSGGAPLLTEQERQLEFYQINLGYNLLPGEAFLSQDSTANTVFYLVAGLGNTDFAGDERFTYNYGFGYRVLFWDAFSIAADMRDHVFDLNVFGEEKQTHNLEYSLALSWYF
jgi:outer membrane beta-barrel protein